MQYKITAPHSAHATSVLASNKGVASKNEFFLLIYISANDSSTGLLLMLLK